MATIVDKSWSVLGVTPEELESFDISDQHKCFAYHYVLGVDKGRFNAGEAARKAGYSKKNNAADVTATRMLRNIELKRFIGFITFKQLAPLKDKFRAEIIERGLAIINADISEYLNPNGTLSFTEWQEVDSRPVKGITQLSSGKFRVDLYDPKEWTAIIDKYMDLAAKADLTVTIKKESDLDSLTDEQLLDYMERKKE